MGEMHSYARLKRKDGITVSITFKDMLEVYDSPLMGLHEELYTKIGELEQYRDTIREQEKDFSTLWDSDHTARVRTAMGQCADKLDTAVQFLTATYEDMALLIGAANGVNSWLNAHPDYNIRWYDSSNNKVYYCAKESYRSGTKHKVTKYRAKPMYLDFPST